jgi:hypothetical protein
VTKRVRVNRDARVGRFQVWTTDSEPLWCHATNSSWWKTTLPQLGIGTLSSYLIDGGLPI